MSETRSLSLVKRSAFRKMETRDVIVRVGILALIVALMVFLVAYNKKVVTKGTEKFQMAAPVEDAAKPAPVPEKEPTNTDAVKAKSAGVADVVAAAAVGEGAFQAVDFPADNKFPRECFPRDKVTPEELMPNMDAINSQFVQMNPLGQGDVSSQNFLTAGYHIGINTQGQSLRNPNLSLRSEPPNPREIVSPWNQSTIEPDLNRRPLEIGGTGCA